MSLRKIFHVPHMRTNWTVFTDEESETATDCKLNCSMALKRNVNNIQEKQKYPISSTKTRFRHIDLDESPAPIDLGTQCVNPKINDGPCGFEKVQSNDGFLNLIHGRIPEKKDSVIRFGRKIAQVDSKISHTIQSLLQTEELWDPLHQIARYVIPNLPPFSECFKQSFLSLHTYFLLDASFSSTYYLNLTLLKTHMNLDEIMIYDFFHALYSLAYFCYEVYQAAWESQSTEVLQAVESDQTMTKMEELLDKVTSYMLPVKNIALVNLLSARLRLMSQIKNVYLDFINLFSWLVQWVVTTYKNYFYGVSDGIKQWIEKVDQIDEVYENEQHDTTTLRVELTKSRVSRLQVLTLLSQGKQLIRKCERMEIPGQYMQPLSFRVRKLEKIISGNMASFVGCDGKTKPYTFYIYGDPGCGKTVMVPHLAHDLCVVLGEPEFDKSRDIYAVMSNTPYHDQYAYQRFAVCNDVLQMKDAEFRDNEIFNIIQMTDESPYPLNIAECSGKGTIYFSSPFVILTSNFDIELQREELMSRMTDPEALKRRINVFIHVNKPKINSNLQGFQREAMSFDVKIGNGRSRTMNWWELLMVLKKDINDAFTISNLVNTVSLTSEEEARLKIIAQDYNPFPCVSSDDLTTEDSCYSDQEREEEMPRFTFSGSFNEYDGNDYIDEAMRECLQSEEYDAIPVLSHVSFPGFQSWEQIKKTLLPLQEPGFMVKLAGGHYWPHVVYDKQAALYLTLYEKQRKIMGVLMFLAGFGASFAITQLIMKAYSKIFSSEDAQAFITTSGGSYEVKNRTIHQPVKRKQFRRIELFEALDSYGWQSPNGAIVTSKIIRNMCLCRNGTRQLCGVFVFGHVLVVPQHLFDSIENDNLVILLPGSMALGLNMQELGEGDVIVSEKNHLVFLNLKDKLSHYPQYSDLRTYFLEYKESSDYVCKDGYMVTYRPLDGYNAVIHQLPLSNIQPDTKETAITDQKFKKTYKIIKSLRSTVKSTDGDCGSFWIMDRGANGGAKIAGVHISGDQNLHMGRATIITKNMISMVAKEFKYGESKLPISEYAVNDLIKSGDEEEFQAIDMLGRTDIKIHQASKTELRPTVWQGIREPLTQPARLKGFMKNGEYVYPQQVSFQKYKGPIKRIPMKDLRNALSYLGDWYQQPVKTQRRVLTLEQAIFGEGDGYNTSVKMDTSLGYPWNQKYKSRSQLFNLNERWISDELRQSCQDLLETGEIDMIMLDSLKDERLSLKKVADGDTRIFTILPFHVNIVLKQLFGDFVFHIEKNWKTSPIKMGISPLPQDWTVLVDWLRENDGEFVAGDYGGWDRKVHYEVMMVLVDWVNEWYSDNYSHVRVKLAEKIFQSTRHLFGNLYRTYGGMPSGCYLTTPFNSLANLLYWYIFLSQKVTPEDMVSHTFWFRPAIYGDDHVISVKDHPEINMKSFSEWITEYGLKYTDARKEIPEDPYVSLPCVTFLKRYFRRDNNMWWGPLELDQLYDMVQWYRHTPATSILKYESLCKLVMEAVLSEAFFHGKATYEVFYNELLSYAAWSCYDLSNNPFTYDYFWRRFMVRDANLTTWRRLIPTTMMTLRDDIFEGATYGDLVLQPVHGEQIQAKDDEQVEPVGEAERHVRENTTTLQLTSEGMQENQTNPLANAQVVSDTLISDPQAIVKDSALSQYRDAQRVEVKTIDSMSVPVVDSNFVFPQGFFSAIERSIPVATVSLTNTTPRPYPLYRFDPLNVLLRNATIRTKLSYAQFVRFNMEIQVKILATNFHYGQIMLVFRPAYLTFLKIKMVKDEANKEFKVSTLAGNWSPYGPYDTVFTASQQPHVVVPITAGSATTLKCPWTLNYQYAPIYGLTQQRYHIGVLDVYMLTPILPTDADPPTLQVFARLADIEGFGYQALADPCATPESATIYTNRYNVEGVTTTFVERIPYAYPTAGVILDSMSVSSDFVPLSTIQSKSNVVARWESQSQRAQIKNEQKEESKNEDRVTKIARRLKKEMFQAGEVQEILNTENVRPISGLFSTISSFIGNATQYLGLSKPPVAQPLSRVLNIAPPIVNSVGEDFTCSTAYHSQCLVSKPRNMHSDVTILSKLAATPMYCGYIQFSNTLRQKTLKIAPHTVAANSWRDAYNMTPAGYIASRFACWRGALRYWLHFSSSSFVNARFQVLLTYHNMSSEPGVVPTQYVEVKGDAIAEGRIPFLWNTQWADFVSEDFEWNIVIRLQDGTPVAWKKDETTAILCSVWIAFDDFQVAQPAMNNGAVIPWGYCKYFEGTHPVAFAGLKRYSQYAPLHSMVTKEPLPEVTDVHLRQITEEVQAGEIPGVIETKKSYAIGMNDIPTSVYHISKRYQTARSSILVPLAPMMLLTDGSQYNGNYAITFNGNVTWFSALFRWVSGSVNVISDAFDSILDVALPGTAYEQYVYDATLFKNNALTSLMGQFHPIMKKFGEKIVAMRQPYRSNVPFVSGPHLSCTWTDNVGYNGMHCMPMQSSLYPQEAIQGVWFHYEPEKTSNAVYAWSFADDLCYNLFLGVPTLGEVDLSSLATALYGPTTL